MHNLLLASAVCFGLASWNAVVVMWLAMRGMEVELVPQQHAPLTFINSR